MFLGVPSTSSYAYEIYIINETNERRLRPITFYDIIKISQTIIILRHRLINLIYILHIISHNSWGNTFRCEVVGIVSIFFTRNYMHDDHNYKSVTQICNLRRHQINSYYVLRCSKLLSYDHEIYIEKESN